MKTKILFASILLAGLLQAQAPQKMTYQAVVRNATGALVTSSPVGIRISILQGSATGAVVYSETHAASTNANGLVTVQAGGGNVISGSFAAINWGAGPFFIKTETDPAGGTNFTVAGTTQLVSVPYALYANGAGYLSQANKVVLTTSQNWQVPAGVSKIRVELWGGAGGGGGVGLYSMTLNDGGYGMGGSYVDETMNVTGGQSFNVTIGNGGNPGNNANCFSQTNCFGDSDGGNGGDTWFGTNKASGGGGGKRGSFAMPPQSGSAGTSNVGSLTAYPAIAPYSFLNVFPNSPRSYIHERTRTSQPGIGGSAINGYSMMGLPGGGEAGVVIITLMQ